MCRLSYTSCRFLALLAATLLQRLPLLLRTVASFSDAFASIFASDETGDRIRVDIELDLKRR